MKIEKVGVLGCGLMGSGIAQVAAQSGCKVVVREIEQRFIDKGFGIIEKILSRAVEKGRMSGDEKDKVTANLTGTLALEDLKDCDLIVEAVVEDLKLKNEMFGQLDKICSEKTIFASNTSSLTIMAMAASTVQRSPMSVLAAAR